MRRHPMHDQLELAYSLATRLRAATRQRRFENQDSTTPSRLVFDKTPRCPTAYLFVAGEQHDGARTLQLQCIEGANGEHGCRDTRFHVVDAGTMQPAADPLKRHSLNQPDIPHSVEVTEHQHLRTIAVEDRSNVIATLGLGERLDLGAERS